MIEFTVDRMEMRGEDSFPGLLSRRDRLNMPVTLGVTL